MVRHLSVLIIEDSETDADLIIRQLQKADYDAGHERVETADQMRKALQRQPWDLVIADYTLPQFSATAALAILQESGLDIPFIVVSGTIGEDKAVEVMKSGANRCIMKDNLARLIPAIERELSEAQTRQAKRAAEQALRESEAKYRRLHESIMDAFASVDMEGRLQEWNHAYRTLTGYSDEELRSLTYWDLTPVKWHDMERKIVEEEVIPLGYSSAYEKEYMRKDGTIIPVEVRTFLVRDETGEPSRMWGIVRDITRHKETKTKLKHAEERYRKLFQEAPVMYVTTKNEDGVPIITDCNDLFLTTLGYARDEVIQKPLADFYAPASRVQLLEGGGYQRALEGTFHAAERNLLARDGHSVHTLLRAMPETDSQDHVYGTRAMFVDITERMQAEMSLRETQARLSSIVRTSPLAMMVTDPEGKVTLWNEAAERIFGWKEEEVLHKQTPIVPEDRMEELRQIRSRVLKGETLENTESVRQRKDGSLIHISFSTTALPASKEHPVEILGIIADITERKRIEESLRENETRFSTIFHASPVAIAITRFKDSVLIDVNKAWEKLTGFTREEAVGHTPIELNAWANPADRDRLISQLSAQVMVKEFEMQLRHKSGSLSYMLMSAELIELAGTRCMLSLSQDITDRKRVEAALKESDEQYRQVIEQINEVLFSLDQNGTITFISSVISAVAGYEPEDLIGHSFKDFIHPDDLPALANEFHARAKGKKEPIEYRIRAKSGETVWVRSSGKALFDGGKFKGIKGLLTDVTEQRKAKEAAGKLEEQLRQSQKLQAIGTLAGGVAHDFNNLLTIILGNADLMLGDLKDDHPFCRPLEETRKAANRAASLTRQLLAFSRKQVIEPKILDLNETIHNTQKMLGRLIGENIRLETNLSDDLWPIEADPGQVEQVIMNLAVNARDAMPDGGDLTLMTQNKEVDEAFFKERGVNGGAGSYAVLRVTDTGTGMSPEIMERIFEPFFTTKGVGKGTGLGLSTVYGIIKQNRGYIFVQSAPEAGTTFEILLPKAEAKKTDEPRETSPQAKTMGSETILVVEDNEDVRAVAVESLNRYGYHVLEATDGESALKLIRSDKGTLHLLLTDVIMPRMGGNQLAEHVSALRPGTKVLFMSGYTDESVSRSGVLKPGLALLHKPFSPEALAKKVREVLDRTGAEGSLG